MCCDFRAAEATEEVTKLRPVRLIREDGIIRPYDLTESQGFDLFQVRSLWPFCSITTRCCLLRGSRCGLLLLKTKTVLPQNQSADKNPKQQQLWTHTPDIYELKTSWAKTHIHCEHSLHPAIRQTSESRRNEIWGIRSQLLENTPEKLYSGAANILCVCASNPFFSFFFVFLLVLVPHAAWGGIIVFVWADQLINQVLWKTIILSMTNKMFMVQFLIL